VQNKRRRQAELLRLVRQQPVGDQAEMVALLRERGFSATQASVSRDVRELGLVKANGHYTPVSRLSGPANEADDLRHVGDLVTAAVPAGANLIVIKTAVGAASAVAVDLDQTPGEDIVGTIAGDDTIFVAVRSRAAQGRVLARLGAGRAS
jgi:transcriptional regulator of arginine metabolism